MRARNLMRNLTESPFLWLCQFWLTVTLALAALVRGQRLQPRPALRGRKETFTVWIPEELKLVRSHTLAMENDVNSHPAVW